MKPQTSEGKKGPFSELKKILGNKRPHTQAYEIILGIIEHIHLQMTMFLVGVFFGSNATNPIMTTCVYLTRCVGDGAIAQLFGCTDYCYKRLTSQSEIVLLRSAVPRGDAHYFCYVCTYSTTLGYIRMYTVYWITAYHACWDLYAQTYP